MSATRKEPNKEPTTSKKLRALKQGAEYGAAGAGATTMGLNVLALCVVISNPIILAIAGFVGSILCCFGARTALQEPDEEDLGKENNKDLKEIKQQLNKVDNEIQSRCNKAKNDPVINHPSHHHQHKVRLFSPSAGEVEVTFSEGPEVVGMESKGEKREVKRASSF